MNSSSSSSRGRNEDRGEERRKKKKREGKEEQREHYYSVRRTADRTHVTPSALYSHCFSNPNPVVRQLFERCESGDDECEKRIINHRTN